MSIEREIKSQFERVFVTSDYQMFKAMAESNLEEAAKLLTPNMLIRDSLKLLARNSRKRLLIGVGVELLLKAVYLKHGFAINKAPKGSQLLFPFTFQDSAGIEVAADQTYMLDPLIENLWKVVDLKERKLSLKGLRIAKVFRNKEGHVVTSRHAFDPTNYTDIAASLSALYRDAFGEKLSVRFSIVADEPAAWKVSALPKN